MGDAQKLGLLATCGEWHVHPVSGQEIESLGQTLLPKFVLQQADVATTVLAHQRMLALVLTDDFDLRRAVEAQELTPMGSVGLLLRAYKAGMLDTKTLDLAIDALFVYSTLYLSPHFKSYVRRVIAEEVARRQDDISAQG